MPEVPTCKNISMLKRYGNENERFSWMYRKQIIDATKCLMPCYFMKYRVIIIFIILLQYLLCFYQFAFQLIDDPIESMYRDPNKTVIVPMFDPTVEVLKEQEAYPILSFVADFGGILGLFIGFNFLMVWGWLMWCGKNILARFK